MHWGLLHATRLANRKILIDQNADRVSTVLDPGSWDRVVVVVGAGCWGNLRWDAGNLEWGGVEEREVSLRVTWDQGGRDPITPRRVSK